MGIESYNVDVVFENINYEKTDGIRVFRGESKVRETDFLRQLMLMPFKVELRAESYLVIEDAIQLFIAKEGDYVSGFYLKGSMTWLEEGGAICYEVIQYTIVNIVKSEIFIRAKKVGDYLAKESFIETIKKRYQEPYEEFIRLYGEHKVKLLPDEFYRYRKKELKRKGNPFLKLFSFFK